MGTVGMTDEIEDKAEETPVGEINADATGSIFPCKPSVKVKKIMYDLGENDDFDRENIPTYEEVGRLYPRPGLTRPLVLIGAPGVGRNELKRRLVATDPEKYKSPVPCKFKSLQLTTYIITLESRLFTFLNHPLLNRPILERLESPNLSQNPGFVRRLWWVADHALESPLRAPQNLPLYDLF